MRRAGGVAVVAAVLAVVLTAPSAPADDVTWVQVGSARTDGVSGLAPAADGWLLARDNKNAGQNRIALLSGSGVVTPLSWPGTEPVDLEALSAVPGRDATWVALTSRGQGVVFTVSSRAVVVGRSFTTPKGSGGIEGFALTDVDGVTVAVWGRRGSTTSPGTVWAATFSPDTGAFGRVVSGRVRVPWPTTAVRHVSDLALVGTRLVGAAASDPGALGPFDSALYDLGTVGRSGDRAVLSLTGPSLLETYPGHKVEGIACAGPTGLVGADDEKAGGWVRGTDVCG